MNLAVKFYSLMPVDDENVLAGINGKIPAEVIFGDAPDKTYKIMDDREYQLYLISIKTELGEWKIIQDNLLQN